VLGAPGVRTTAGAKLRGRGGSVMAERDVKDFGYEYVPNSAASKLPAEKGPGTQAGAENILKDWLECLRTRRKTICNEEETYYSTLACFMANRAFQTRSRVVWDAKWELS
jgi:hypothetical protein